LKNAMTHPVAVPVGTIGADRAEEKAGADTPATRSDAPSPVWLPPRKMPA
jgi:hypothetical protein